MKRIAYIGLLLILTGCTTTRKAPRQTLDQAIRASVETRGIRTDVVIHMAKDGAMTVAGMPITREELKHIRSVNGLSADPPSVLLRADRETKHEYVKDCLDALSESGIWKISFQAEKNE